MAPLQEQEEDYRNHLGHLTPHTIQAITNVMRRAGKTLVYDNIHGRRPSRTIMPGRPFMTAVGGRKKDYSHWLVTEDNTIETREDDDGPMEMIRALCDRIRYGESNDWRVDGLELVSRILPAPAMDDRMMSSSSVSEVRDYLLALKGKKTDIFGAFVNSSCGLHVHVGVSPESGSKELPLDVIQHLAYFCVQFEGLMSRLFPWERSGLPYDPGSPSSKPSLPAIKGTNHSCERYPLPLMHQLKKKIFSLSKEALIEYMSNDQLSWADSQCRYRFVNFTSLQIQGKSTVEFRQHEGALDSEQVGQWIAFVIAIVRAAEVRALARRVAIARKAELDRSSSLPESPKSPIRGILIPSEGPIAPLGNVRKYVLKCKEQEDQFHTMCDYLDLTRMQRKYWLERFKKYNQDEVRNPADPRSICEVCQRDVHDLFRIKSRQDHYRQLRHIWNIRSKSLYPEEKRKVEAWMETIREKVAEAKKKGSDEMRRFFASGWQYSIPKELKLDKEKDDQASEFWLQVWQDNGSEYDVVSEDEMPNHRTKRARSKLEREFHEPQALVEIFGRTDIRVKG